MSSFQAFRHEQIGLISLLHFTFYIMNSSWPKTNILIPSKCLENFFFFLNFDVLCAFHQIRSLTWFTRFDSEVPKEQVFSVEEGVKTSENINEVGVTGAEQEGTNRQNYHDRKGEVSVPLSFFHLSSLPLNPPCLFQTLCPPCPASTPGPGSCLPSIGCAGWRGRRREAVTRWHLPHPNRLPVSWRKNRVWNASLTLTSSFACVWPPLSLATGLDGQVVDYFSFNPFLKSDMSH